MTNNINSVNAYQSAGAVVWLTGLSGAGKTTLAEQLHQSLVQQGRSAVVLDGDVLRRGLCSDLGFTPADRAENLRRAAEVARLFAAQQFVVLCAFISPYASERANVRNLVGDTPFFEVFCDCPLEICERRDVKGLYHKARQGQVLNFTGLSAPYEPPHNPDIRLYTGVDSLHDCAQQVLRFLEARQVIASAHPSSTSF